MAKRLTSLSKIAFKYGSERCPQSGHSYTEYYYGLLKDKRQEIKKVLEIGIGPKASGLLMWREFFANAKIYGADKRGSFLMRRIRIESVPCDQSNREDVIRLIERTGSDIDLVVDDGSHVPNDQVLTCQTLMPYLPKDVIYIIESVVDPSIIDRLGNYACEVPKLPRNKKRGVDRLIVVRHKKGYRKSKNDKDHKYS